jgi:preprotein translocase subunit SecA
VIYEQRRRVLEGEDLSEDVREWIRETVERVVHQYTEAEYSDDWDLAGLVAAMGALYGSDITQEELREEVDLEREALVEEFVDDAFDTYREREQAMEAMQPGLMRDLERFVILQVVDSRWREHLDSMDYLRDGIHLRAMAQKDPLVEYRAEGHAMFEELGATIREEVVNVLFHANVEIQPQQLEPTGPPTDGDLQYEHETARGAEVIESAAGAPAATATATAAAGAGAAVLAAPPQGRVTSGGGQVVNEHKDIGRNDPCWCGSGKKYKKCHGA